MPSSTASRYCLTLDIRQGRAKVEVWQHGRRLAPDEAREVILEAYERLRAARGSTPGG